MNWEEVSLNEIGIVSRGKSKHRPRDAAHLYGGPYPFIQTGDVKHSNLYISSYKQTYSEEGLKQSKLWKKGTLCITIAANIADTAILDLDACFPDSVIGFIPDETKCDVKYIKYKFDLIQSQFKQFSQGAAQDNLSLEKLISIKFKLPPLPIQQKISVILSAYDDLIENNLKRIALLEKSARLLYEEWFVRLRFPGFEHTKIVNSVLEGWKSGVVQDVLELQRGFDLPVQSRDSDGLIPIIASTGIAGFHSKHKVEGPGVVTGRSGTIGKVLYVEKAFWPLNTSLWVKKYFVGGPLFAYQFLQTLSLEKFAGGAAVPSLDRKNVHAISVIIPPSTLIKNFEEVVEPIHEQIEKLRLQNQKLKQARDILLPKLINGEIPV